MTESDFMAGSFFCPEGEPLEEKTVALLKKKKITVATAESCTAGLLSKRITNVSGASEIFECGIVSYANRIKEKLLFAERDKLIRYGAVSAVIAAEMACGVRKQGDSVIGVGITGIAGPGSDSTDKPVGLVYVALCGGDKVKVKELKIPYRGENIREYNRYYSSSAALEMIYEYAKVYPDRPEGMTDLTEYISSF